MMNRLSLPALLLLLCCPLLSFATEPDSLFQSADSSTPLPIQISAPFTTIDRQRDKTEVYHHALVSYLDDRGNSVSLEVKLQPRGNFRLQRDTCRYSQLWVDFDKDEVAGTLFEHQNRLKLVLQCRSPERYREYLVREKIAYDMFNLISDNSLRTRLLEVTYVDTDRGRENRTQLAFFVEHQNRLAEHRQMEVVKERQISLASLDPAQANRVDLFMLMIANTDYSMLTAEEGSCCHNSKLLQDASGRNFPVPYDFDGSGLVNADYADPNPALPIRSNRQRLYRGFCRNDDVLAANIRLFLDQKDNMLALLSSSPHLDASSKQRDLDYLGEFFAVLSDEDDTRNTIVRHCREP